MNALQASRCIEQWVDAEVGPLWTRQVLLHMAALLTEHSGSMRSFLDTLDLGTSPWKQFTAWDGERDDVTEGEGSGERLHGPGAKDLPVASLGLLAAALGHDKHWLTRLVAHFGAILGSRGGSSIGCGGGSSEVRAASLTSTMQSVLDLCSSCCRLSQLETRDAMVDGGKGHASSHNPTVSASR